MSEKISKSEMGMYLKSLRTKAPTGNYEDGSAANGAAATGTTIISEILDQLQYFGTSVYADAVKTVVSTPGNVVRVPSNIDSLDIDASEGTRAYWTAEADEMTISKLQFRGVNMKLGKITVRVPVTEELEEDAIRLADHVIQSAARAILVLVEREMLLGNGTAIAGVAGSGDDATSIIAITTPSEAELLNCVAALHPQAKATWYVSKAVEKVLLGTNWTNETSLTFEDGQMFLFGRPVVVHPAMIASPYDIVLGDFSRYALVMKRLVSQMSSQIRFIEGENEYVIKLRIAGNTFATTSATDEGTFAWFVCSTDGEAGYSSSSESSESSESSSKSSLSSVSSKSSASSLTSLSSLSSYGTSLTSKSSSSSGPVSKTVTWAEDPDATYLANGDYAEYGTYGGETTYRQMDGTFYIWKDGGANKWVISDEIGTLGAGYWLSASSNITAAYSAGGLATEDLVIGA